MSAKAKGLVLAILILALLAAPAARASYIRSIDTMKLSADHADLGLTPDYQQALGILAGTHADYITDDCVLEYPATCAAWANAIHVAHKRVWYRAQSFNLDTLAHGDSGASQNFQAPYDGYPTYAADGYLTQWHKFVQANASIFQNGDIIDANTEPEDSAWWRNQYGCDIQSSCTNCPALGTMTKADVPCRPWSEFNHDMKAATDGMRADLSALGKTPCTGLPAQTCIFAGAHSVDYGTAQDGPLATSTVIDDGNVVTIDGYVCDTNPSSNASTMASSIANVYNYWKTKIPSVKILLGEWGYNNCRDVTDHNQVDVITADERAILTLPWVIGQNYWVSPGGVGWGGYTYLMRRDSNLVWTARPALNTLSGFYQQLSGAHAKQLAARRRRRRRTPAHRLTTAQLHNPRWV